MNPRSAGMPRPEPPRCFHRSARRYSPTVIVELRRLLFAAGREVGAELEDRVQLDALAATYLRTTSQAQPDPPCSICGLRP